MASQLAKLTVASQFLTFKFNAVSVEQGQAVDMAVKVNKAADFAGEAQVTLIGLPNKVTTDPQTITKDTNELVFHLKTDPESPPGETKSLFCQVVITQDGEPIVHNLGSGRLRIDAPIAPKPNAAATAAPPPVTADASSKTVSRLEKLRLESQERAKAKAAGLETPAEPPTGRDEMPVIRLRQSEGSSNAAALTSARQALT